MKLSEAKQMIKYERTLDDWGLNFPDKLDKMWESEEDKEMAEAMLLVITHYALGQNIE